MNYIFNKKRIVTKTASVVTQGFTLIETLVAITILMISIVGPLTIASKGLSAAVNSKDQVIASYLAQDLMENIMNIRDNALLQNSQDSTTAWNNVFLPFVSMCVNATCGLETSPGITQTPFSCGSNNLGCQMYIDKNYLYYTYASGGGNQKTEFYRTFRITPETGSPGLPDAAEVTVQVTWTNGSVKSKIVLNAILFNTQR